MPLLTDRLLSRAQAGSLALMIFFGVISRPRQMLLEISPQPNIPIEFRIIALSIPDFFVLALLLLSGLRLLLSAAYRARLLDTAQAVVTRLGGLWWAGLALWTVAGLVWALDATMLRFGLAHLIAMLVMALVLADQVRADGARLPLLALAASGVIQAGIALLQVLNNGPLGLWALGEIDRFDYDPLDFYRAPGLAMHYNYLGGYLMLGLFACLGLGWQRRGRGRWAALTAAGIISLGILSTLSRGTMVATATGLLPLGLLLITRMGARARWMAAGAAGVLLALAAAYVLFALGDAGNIAVRFLTPREFFFDYSWAVIQQSPVLGVGMGNLMLAAGRMWGLGVENLLPVHNVYLYVWAEHGLPGLALYLLGCAALLRRLRPAYGLPLFIWTCGVLAVCVANVSDNYLWAVQPFRVVFFWVIGVWWGLAYPLAAPESVLTPHPPAPSPTRGEGA
jgi:hypothetical protein